MNSLMLLALAFSSTAMASDDDFHSARQDGMGRIGVADPWDNSGILVNPATLALTDRYDAAGAFAYGPTNEFRWGVSLADARTNDRVAFGFSYSGTISNPPFLPEEIPAWGLVGEDPTNGKQYHDLSVGVAIHAFERKLTFGINGGLWIRNTERLGKGTTGNMDFGMAARPVEWLSIGVVGRNVLPVKEQVDRPAALLSGIRVGVEEYLVAEFDLNYRFEYAQQNPLDIHYGLQAGIKVVRLRVGHDWNGDINRHTVSWGIGAENKAGSFDYAMRIPAFQGMVFGDVQHVLSITLRTDALKGEKEDDSMPTPW